MRTGCAFCCSGFWLYVQICKVYHFYSEAIFESKADVFSNGPHCYVVGLQGLSMLLWVVKSPGVAVSSLSAPSPT